MDGLPDRKWLKPHQARWIVLQKLDIGWEETIEAIGDAIYDDLLKLRIVFEGKVEHVACGTELCLPWLKVNWCDDNEPMEISRESLLNWAENAVISPEVMTEWGPAVPVGKAVRAGAEAKASYTTPYIELLQRIIVEKEISEDEQPKKDDLISWFMEQEVEGKTIPKYIAEVMATIVRLPKMQRGGARSQKESPEGLNG